MKERKNPYSSLIHLKGHANRRIVYIGCLLLIAMTSIRLLGLNPVSKMQNGWVSMTERPAYELQYVEDTRDHNFLDSSLGAEVDYLETGFFSTHSIEVVPNVSLRNSFVLKLRNTCMKGGEDGLFVPHMDDVVKVVSPILKSSISPSSHPLVYQTFSLDDVNGLLSRSEKNRHITLVRIHIFYNIIII